MIHFVGAGSGAVDLITVRGQRLLEKADVVIYAGSLVNAELLKYTKENCKIFNSAYMTLNEIIDEMVKAEEQGFDTVRLHTGDPSLYGAIKEQIDILKRKQIAFDICPGVSSFSAAAASLGIEYTLPDVSQSLIITRAEGRTTVPEREHLSSFASHRSTMVLFLSSGLAKKVQDELIRGGYPPDTPAVVVYKASWPDEKIIRTKLSSLCDEMVKKNITKTALIIVGDVLDSQYSRSKLYDENFSTEYRKGKQ